MPLSKDILRDLHEENQNLKNENQLLLADIGKLRQSIRSVYKLQNELEGITAEAHPIELINAILSSALEAVNCKNGSLMLLDEDTGELVFVHVLGSAAEKLVGYRLSPGEGIANWVINTKRPKLVLNAQDELHFSPLVDQLASFLTTSLICVPLIATQRVLGAIEVVLTSGDSFRQEDVEVMMLVAHLASLAIVRVEQGMPS
ncbi:MAG: GAF domain-containing protein [Anaerolineales bacterium]